MTRRFKPEVMAGIRDNFNAGEISKAQRSDQIVARASRVIDMLTGRDPFAERLSTQDAIERRTLSSPDSIPQMGWTHNFDGSPTILSSIGGLFVDRFNDVRPSDVFNTGFYAGVLAAREGLVDPDEFALDTELMDDFDPSSVFIDEPSAASNEQ